MVGESFESKMIPLDRPVWQAAKEQRTEEKPLKSFLNSRLASRHLSLFLYAGSSRHQRAIPQSYLSDAELTKLIRRYDCSLGVPSRVSHWV